MHPLIARHILAGLFWIVCAVPSTLRGQASNPPDALSAVVEAMFFRRSELGDSLPFDACSVFERSGRPAGFPERILPGLRPLLDRDVPDPCSLPRPSAGSRFERIVRVDSVAITGSLAQVHLHVRRGEWTYEEVYHLEVRPTDGAWALREVRMYPGIHTTPPPPGSR